MDLGITGKTAAVAAASTGLGYGCAKALLEEGVSVAICSRDQQRIDAAAERLRRETVGELRGNARVVALVADVSTTDGATSFYDQARQALGDIDILVCNAGGPPPGKASTTDLDGYRAALDLNLLSTITLCQAALPAMTEKGWGRIVAITSIGAKQPVPFLAASSVARAGVTSFVKVLATEVAASGVTVNSAQPGLHATDRVTALGNPQEMAAAIPSGTLGTAEDFGKAVAFLCSEPARFITGTGLLLDGGAYPGLL